MAENIITSPAEEDRHEAPAPAEVALHLPEASKVKAVTFTILTLVAAALNIACGLLTYSIFSKGEILNDLYTRLVATDINMFVWISAGIGLLGTIATLIAYITSFDFRRTARPIIRLWILFTSFGLFLAGLALGILEISADNVPVILGAIIVCFALPFPVLLLERTIGRGAVRSAEKFLASHAAGKARASARTALTFAPGNQLALTAYARALSATGKPLQSLPYLLYVEQREVPLQPHTALALADAWEAAAEPAKTVEYLDMLPAELITPDLLNRQVRLWLQTGLRDRALEAIRSMDTDARRPWRSQYQQLLVARKERKSLHDLATEYQADEQPPFENTVQCLKEILTLYPSDTQALDHLITLQKQLKQPATVAALQEELIAIDEARLDVRRELVQYYWEHGNREQLINQLNRIMLSGQATTDEKVRLVEEIFADGDYLSVSNLVEREPDLGNNPRALAILANALYQGGRADDALERIAQARRLNPDERLLHNLDVLSGKIRKNVLDAELHELEQKSGDTPENLDLKFEYMDRLVAARSADRVVVELEDMLQKSPDLRERIEKEIRVMLSRHGKNRRLMDYLGDLYLRTGQYDQAFDLYERRAQGEMDSAEIMHDAMQRILDRKPDHPASLLSEAEYFYNLGDAAQSLTYYDRLIATGTRLDSDVRNLELDASEKAGNFQRAQQVAESLLQAEPENLELLLRAGDSALQRKDFPSAIAHYQRASELEPDSFDHRKKLRNATETMKRDRIAEIKEQLKATPGDRDLLEELGDLYHDFEQFNDAIAAYQRAGMNDVSRRVPKAKQGYILAKKGLFTDADEILQQADLNSELPEDEQDRLKGLFFATAQLMEGEEEMERALELHRRIFRVDASYRDVVNHIERLQTLAKKKRQSLY